MRTELGWKGLDETVRAFGGFQPAVASGLSRGIRRGTTAAKRSVKASAPRKAKGPHRVAQGVRSRVSGRGAGTVGRVYLTGIAVPVAKGAKPHVIEAENVKALRLPQGFRSRVHHPGFPGRDFFRRGVDRATPEIERVLEGVGDDVLRRLSSSR